jgi:hypothetical protein
MVVLAVLDRQPIATAPPFELVATENPTVGDVSVKVPPVELDMVTRTLVVFTWIASATEPVAIVNVVG